MPRFGMFRFGLERFGLYSAASLSIAPRAKYVLGAGGYTGQGVTVNGYAIKGKDMLPNESLIQAIQSKVSAYELKLYIQDSNYNWVDFSDRANINGRNQLRKIGNISYSSEGLQGNIRQRVSTLVLDNSDGFWTKPFPPTLYASYDSDWNWKGDRSTVAQFGYSHNRRHSVLYRHRVCLKANFLATGTDIPQELTLGVFLVDRSTTNMGSGAHTLTLTSLEFPLAEEEADKVKDSLDWYQNRPPNFLVEELLKTVYTATDGITLPVGTDIDNIVDYRVPRVADSTGWAISHSGRVPERVYSRTSTTGYETTPEWNPMRGQKGRAICAHELTVGTLSVVAGSEVVTCSSLADSLGIIAGDVLTIPREYSSGDGGSEDHFGNYSVESVSGADITLTSAVLGSDDESGLKWAVSRMYIGAENHLYQYNQATDSYYRLTEDSGAETLPSGYTIRRLWYNENDSTYPIWGVALSTPAQGEVGRTMQIFRFRMNGTEPLFEKWGSTVPYVMFGEFCEEWPSPHNPQTTSKRYAGRIASADMLYSDRMGIPIIFDQHLTSAYDLEIKGVFWNSDATTKISSSDVSDIYSGTQPDTYVDGGVSSAWLRRGYYSATWAASCGAVRTTLGQEGFMLFHPNWGSGSLIYAKHNMTETVPDSLASGAYDHTYYYIDLTGSSPTEVAITMGIDWSDLDSMEHGMPTCGAVDLGEDGLGTGFYIGTHSRGYDNAYEENFAYFWSKTVATAESDIMYRIPTDSAGLIPIEMECLNGVIFAVSVGVATINDVGVNYVLSVSKPGYFPYEHIGDTTRCVVDGWWNEISASYGIYGLTPMTIDGEDVMFFVEAETQRLRYVSITEQETLGVPLLSSETTTVEYTGFMPDEPYAASNIYGSSNTMQMMWVSSPSPNFTVPELTEGRFLLNQWSYSAMARVDLADFSDMKVWQAIGYLAEKADALYGFNPDGTFFFKGRPRSINSEYTFTNVGSNQIADITVDDGYGEIVNSASRSPSRVTVPPSEITWELSPESDYGDTGYRHDIAIFREDMASRSIKLICTNGGKLSEEGDTIGTPGSHEVRFSHEAIDASISATLAVDFMKNAGSITLDNEFKITYGATIRIEGQNQEQLDDDDLTIDSVWGYGRVGYVMQQNSGGIQDIVLSADVTATTNTIPLKLNNSSAVNLSSSMPNGETIDIGSIVALGKLTSGTGIEYCQVIEVNGESLIVQREVFPERGPRVTHDLGDAIAVISSGNRYFLRSGESGMHENYGSWGGVLFVSGDSVTIDLPSAGLSSTFKAGVNGTDDTLHSDATEFIPISNVFVEVGGTNTTYSTGVKLRFSYSGDDGNESSYSKGDLIRINCPGLSLSNDSTVSHVYTDMGSVDTFTKRDSRYGGNNPFLSDDDTRWQVRRDVNENRFPKHTFTVLCVAQPWILPGKIATIQSPEMLPLASEHKEVVYISSIGYNLQHNGMMEVVCRAVDPY